MPADREEVVIARGTGETTSERVTDLFWVGLDESATANVKLVVLVAVGVPERMPVVGGKLKPAGREPAVMDQT